MSRRLEPAHRFLTQSRRLVRILRTVILPLLLEVFDTRYDFLLGHLIALELIGDDHARHVLQTLQELAEELLRGSQISAALDEDVQHVAVLIHRTPQVMGTAVDLDEDFIHVPLVTLSRTPAAQAVGVSLTKLATPIPDSLIGDGDAAHRHDLFDIAVAQVETEVESHAMTNYFSRETMAAVGGGGGTHQQSMPHAQSYFIFSCLT